MFGLILNVTVNAAVSIEPYPAQAFNPTSKKHFVLPISITEPGKLAVSLYTADGDWVRTLSSGKPLTIGTHTIVWDGKDSHNTIVPNEAYTPVVELVTDKTTHTLDPRHTSGGEEITITPQLNNEGQIVFQLEKPTRVLARAGVKSGPLLKSILHWQVRGQGRNVVFWNGYDQDNLKKLTGSDQLALLVTGFTLPDHTILTVGNKTLDYAAWRKHNGWSSSMPDLSEVAFERDGQRISRHYYLPRSVDIAPRINLEIVEKLPKNKEGIPVVFGPVTLKVTMHEEDRWAMQQSLYEVAFFVDEQFLSEEEQGYVPLNWRWNPAGLEPGIHRVTVNVSGFNGQVGVKSLAIEIPTALSHVVKLLDAIP
ncbi:hypothetical protein AB835_04050 [Candidatus Endobugula sertula]|uniref:FlgD Ig-like domain-containing protein n=1 Tax=Candidatus Endobugula sertula TaxID=62101 RepID=A0A1D2QRX4_9GAMM|nr:hypothetical protein AB835_04050 [Candidatus Endobugula sertula]